MKNLTEMSSLSYLFSVLTTKPKKAKKEQDKKVAIVAETREKEN
jgi:hypothetical protein